MRFSDFMSKPYLWSLAIKRLFGRPPKAFHRSGNKGPKTAPLSTISRPFYNSLHCIITILDSATNYNPCDNYFDIW